MTRRIILTAITVDDAPNGTAHAASDGDLIDGIRARLDEFYPTDDGYPYTPLNVTATVVDPDTYTALVAAANVGLDGGDEDSTGHPAEVLDEAHAALAILNGEEVTR